MNDLQNKKPIWANPLVLVATAMLCCALWGSATPAIKNGYELLDVSGVASIMLFAGLRFFLAGILTVLIFSLIEKKPLIPKRENLKYVAVISVFQTILQYVFFYLGLDNTTGVKGTVTSGSGAFFALIVAALIFRQEKFTLRKIIACVLGFSGIVLMNLGGLSKSGGNGDLLGVFFVLISTIAASFGSVFIKRYSSRENPVTLSGYQFALGGLVMIAVGLAMGGKINMSNLVGVLDLIYLAFLSAVAYSLWCILLKHNPVSRVSAFNFMIPLFGVLLTRLFLPNEATNVKPLQLFFTLVLICLGIFLLNYTPSAKSKSGEKKE